MAINILIFIIICLLFVFLRENSFRKHRKKCHNSFFIIPKRTYFWHISGPFLIYMLMGFMIYVNGSGILISKLPSWCFSILAGILAGVCTFLILTYFLTQAGIYENGILTHFTFIESNQIERVELTNDNSLNINSKIKTLKIYLKNQKLKGLSIEYLVQNEEDLKAALKRLNIQEG